MSTNINHTLNEAIYFKSREPAVKNLAESGQDRRNHLNKIRQEQYISLNANANVIFYKKKWRDRAREREQC